MQQNKLSYSLLAVFMAILMFLSSVSFVLDMHYCGNNLVSINLFGKAKNCKEITQIAANNACSSHSEIVQQHQSCSFETKGCCSNKTIHFQADLDKQTQASDVQFSASLQHFTTAFIVAFNNLSIIIDREDRSSFSEYRPPLIPRDYSALFQSFLI